MDFEEIIVMLRDDAIVTENQILTCSFEHSEKLIGLKAQLEYINELIRHVVKLRDERKGRADIIKKVYTGDKK